MSKNFTTMELKEEDIVHELVEDMEIWKKYFVRSNEGLEGAIIFCIFHAWRCLFILNFFNTRYDIILLTNLYNINFLISFFFKYKLHFITFNMTNNHHKFKKCLSWYIKVWINYWNITQTYKITNIHNINFKYKMYNDN